MFSGSKNIHQAHGRGKSLFHQILPVGHVGEKHSLLVSLCGNGWSSVHSHELQPAVGRNFEYGIQSSVNIGAFTLNHFAFRLIFYAVIVNRNTAVDLHPFSRIDVGH